MIVSLTVVHVLNPFGISELLPALAADSGRHVQERNGEPLPL